MSNERGAREHGVAVVGGSAGSTRDDAGPSDVKDEAVAEEVVAEEAAAAGDAGGAGTGGRRPGGDTPRARVRPVAPQRTKDQRRLVSVLAAVTVLSVLAAVVFGVKWSDANAQNQTRATVQRVAKDFLVALTNFTPKTVDADFRTIETYATGDFAKQANQTFGSHIRQQLAVAQAWMKGQIRYEYVQSLDGDQANVYAEVDSTYANNKVTSPIADVLQVVMNLRDTAGGWKIAAVTVLQPPNAQGGSSSGSSGGSSPVVPGH